MSSGPLRMIMDVDTGVDNALALALAVRHPLVQLEAVLTVVVDLRPHAAPAEPTLTRVCMDVDVARFEALFRGTLGLTG